MSAARLLRRISGRGGNSIAEEKPMLTHRAHGRGRPVPRTIEQWCLIFSLVVLGGMALWMTIAGTSLARSSTRVSELSFRAPTLDDYLATLPGKHVVSPTEAAPLTPAEIAAINVPSMVERSFESIRKFENGRAEFRLGKMKAVTSSVQPGSPAQQSGLQRGDEVVAIWGKPARFVWEYLSAVASNGAPSAEIEFKRGEITYRATLMLASGAPLDVGNIGIQFDFPDGVRYLAPGDTRRLAEDFIRGFIEALPPEWRRVYAASLDAVMRGLVKHLDDQQAKTAQDPTYLRSDRLLVWHHEAFLAEVERMRSETAAALQSQAASLNVLGRATAGLATALILALVSLWFHARNRASHRSRR